MITITAIDKNGNIKGYIKEYDPSEYANKQPKRKEGRENES